MIGDVDDLQVLSARDLTDALRHRAVSAREALASHLARVEQVNPALNAIVTLAAEQAERAALAADERAASVADPAELPLLHGLPMTHKDTHQVAGMRTTQGSPVLADHVSEADDLVVARLRGAGVVSTGKSNVPEFAAGSHTFNEVFGTTVNPWALDRSAGGSSGGVAAALAAGVQPLGDGSDMGGSLRIPASFCNVVGFRPSYGVLPCPAAHDNHAWLARTGPMAREVDDVALFLAAVAGPDRRVRPPSTLGGADFAALLDEPVGDLRGVRVGWSPDLGLDVPVDPEVLDALTAQLGVLEEAGAIVERAEPDLRGADEVFSTTRAVEFAAGLGDVVRRHRDQVKPEVVWNVERGWALGVEDLIAAAAARTRLDAAVASWFERYDLLLCPAAQVVPFDATLRYPASVAGVASQTYLDWMRIACVVSATGLPALSLPFAFTPDGLPVGLQMVADHDRDVDLLRWARVLEQRTGAGRRRPVLPSAGGPDPV